MGERERVNEVSPRAEHVRPGTLRTRLAWFVGLWFGGVFAVTVVAYGIRAFLV